VPPGEYPLPHSDQPQTRSRLAHVGSAPSSAMRISTIRGGARLADAIRMSTLVASACRAILVSASCTSRNRAGRGRVQVFDFTADGQAIESRKAGSATVDAVLECGSQAQVIETHSRS